MTSTNSKWLLYAGFTMACVGLFLSISHKFKPDDHISTRSATYILTAKESLKTGQLLSTKNLKWKLLNEGDQEVEKSELILAETEMEKDTIVNRLAGAVLRQNVEQEDAIYEGQLVKSGEAGFLAYAVKPGMRAVSVDMKPSAISDGLVSPGDIVDLIITTQAHQVRSSVDSLPSKRDFRTWRSAIAATGLRILAINRVSTGVEYSNDGLGIDRKTRFVTVTFEASPEQTVRIPLAEQMAASGGVISISLRNPNDNEIAYRSSGASDLFPETKDSGLDENTFLIRGEKREVSGGL